MTGRTVLPVLARNAAELAFTEALDEFPEELVLGPVRSRVRNDLQAVEFPARALIRGRWILSGIWRSWG
jgi:hypothetical protein